MNTREALRAALRSLRAHKLRSVLTMIGIVIGITAVVSLVDLGNGMKAGFQKSLGELAKAIIVEKVEGSVPGGRTPKQLRDGDVTALLEAPAVDNVIPLLSRSALIETSSGGQFRGQAFGSTVNFLSVNNRELAQGSMFTIADQQNKAKVVVLAPDVVEKLFHGDAKAAIGSQVGIANTTFTVVGVLRSDGNFDDMALMPLTTARGFVYGGDDEITSMAAKAKTVADVPAAVNQITEILTKRHKIQDPAKRDFKITALQKPLEQFNQVVRYVTLFIIAVAAISLLVGGIGVANIMLVSVTERTREIGVRKALGATRMAVLKQFLIESMILTGLGGALGAGLGVGITLAAAALITKYAPTFGAPTISVPAIVVALATSVAIGLVAGCYPALRAALMRPVDALRYE